MLTFKIIGFFVKTYSLLLGLFFSYGVLAHPHAFIDMQTTPIIENNQLAGLSMKWTLDEASSSAVIYDMKQAKTKNEQQKLIDDVMGNVVSEHYFSYLYDNQHNKIKYSPHPKNYGVKIQGLQLQYYFDVPLAHSQNLEKNTFSLQTYDPTHIELLFFVRTSHLRNHLRSFGIYQVKMRRLGFFIHIRFN